MEEEKPDIDLAKYRKHKKEIPWPLIRKLIIAVILASVLLYLYNYEAKSTAQIDDSELEIEFPD